MMAETSTEEKIRLFRSKYGETIELARKKFEEAEERYEGKFTILDYFKLHGMKDLAYEVWKDVLRIINLIENEEELTSVQKAELEDKVPDLINYTAMIPALMQFYKK